MQTVLFFQEVSCQSLGIPLAFAKFLRLDSLDSFVNFHPAIPRVWYGALGIEYTSRGSSLKTQVEMQGKHWIEFSAVTGLFFVYAVVGTLKGISGLLMGRAGKPLVDGDLNSYEDPSDNALV